MNISKQPLHRLAVCAVAELASELEDTGGAERWQPHTVATSGGFQLVFTTAVAFSMLVVAVSSSSPLLLGGTEW